MANVPKMEARAPSPGVSGSVRRASGNADAERELVKRAQAGDQFAYEEMVRIHQPRLLAVIGGIMRRGGDCVDWAQQGLFKADILLEGFDLRSAFGTLVFRIAVKGFLD